MSKQKIYLKRIKKFQPNPNQPDYEGFFRTKNGDFYVIGYLKDLSSNLDLTIKKVVSEELKKNKFLLKKYSEWRVKNEK